MTISTVSFQSILEDAKVGRLQLPEFQRDYVWVRSQVIDLFDSLRQRYPIGSLLFMERNPEIAIEPRPFEGTNDTIEAAEPEAFVLDGQQRITSGLVLYYGLGASQYYIDLKKLWAMAQEANLDLGSARAVTAFLEDIDTDDAYCVGRLRRADPLFLLKDHLLYTGVLHNSALLRDALRKYVALFPHMDAFIDSVVRDNFRLGNDVYVPVTVVEKTRPVEAVSRIFATLNTTGRPLNSLWPSSTPQASGSEPTSRTTKNFFRTMPIWIERERSFCKRSRSLLANHQRRASCRRPSSLLLISSTRTKLLSYWSNLANS